jgi:hypothetical protein
MCVCVCVVCVYICRCVCVWWLMLQLVINQVADVYKFASSDRLLEFFEKKEKQGNDGRL